MSSARFDFAKLMDGIDTLDWLDFVGTDYRVTNGGSDAQLRDCPFCGGGGSRTYLSIEKKVGICFHGDCDRRFNLFSFARATLGCDSAGTFRHFESYAPASYSAPARVRVAPLPLGDWKLPDSVLLPTEGDMTHPYLLARGVLLETQRHFGLRWCEKGLYEYEDLEGRAKRMPFDQRILLPIHDLDGSLVSFVGRDVTGEAEQRYLFPPLLPSGGRHLYGAEHLSGREHIVIGEGSFDAIAIHQAVKDHPDFKGIAATASFGLSIGNNDPGGDDQLGRLRKLRALGLKRVTMLWDAEFNAFERALKAAKLLTGNGFQVHLGLLPGGADPAEVETRVVREAIADAQLWTPAYGLALALQPPYHRKISHL